MKTLPLMIMLACAGAGTAFAQTPMADQDQTAPVRLSGVVEIEGQKELRTAAVTLTRLSATGTMIGPPLTARMYPDGAFFFVRVAPGRYLLRASAQPFDDKKSMHGSQEVTVANTAINTLRLVLRQSMPIAPPPASALPSGFAATTVPPMPPEPPATKPPVR